MGWISRGNRKRHKCPDGSYRDVFKNPKDAFPLYTKDWAARFQVFASTLKAAEGGISLDIWKQLSGLFVRIDDINGTLVADFTMLYTIYSHNPCHEDEWLKREVVKIIGREHLLRARMIMNRIQADLGNEQALRNSIIEADRRLSEIDTESSLSSEFAKAEKNVSLWGS